MMLVVVAMSTTLVIVRCQSLWSTSVVIDMVVIRTHEVVIPANNEIMVVWSMVVVGMVKLIVVVAAAVIDNTY